MLDTRTDAFENKSSNVFLSAAKDYRSNDGVGVAKGYRVLEDSAGSGFETGDFVKAKLGKGYRRRTPLPQLPKCVASPDDHEGGVLLV